MRQQENVPSRQVLTDCMQVNLRAGHENAGFLSESHGFMPVFPPLQYLPEGFRLWDELAEQLPDLHRTLRLRSSFDALKTLDAAQLPETALLRASALLSIFAHAYYHIDPTPPDGLPACLQRPWESVARRLGHPAPALTYIDLIIYNWRLLDPARNDAMCVENLRLLIPTVDNREERLFYLTQVEVLARCSSIVGAVVRAQEAVHRDDPEALKRELVSISDCLRQVTYGSMRKINPNPHSDYYVDPIVWAKTVAPLAVPVHAGVAGPSGAASPIFNLLDEFFGRREHQSMIGHGILHARDWYPRNWQAFLQAVGEVSVDSYVVKKAERELTGVFQEALNAYAGEDGFLGRHRLQAYGYLALAFKVGRSVTIGGFAGLFKDRTWSEINDALEASRLERYYRSLYGWRRAQVKAVPQAPFEGNGHAHHIVLDVSDTGLRYEPGDRCCVLSENSPELIEKTLKSLRATGDETILLNLVWQQAVAMREGNNEPRSVPLRTLLRLGQIRPVQRTIAKRLYAITLNRTLGRILEARAEDQWELWDLLNLLSSAGFDPKTLWKAHPGDPESLVWIVPPMLYRTYSISSAMEPDDGRWARELHLTVGELEYETRATEVSAPGQRRGTASCFLGRVAQEARVQPRSVSVKLIHPPRFALPPDETRPIVMLAGGTGFAPFRGFLRARAQQPQAGATWLFLSARTRDALLYREELAELAAADRLNLRVAFTRDDVKLRLATTDGNSSFVFEPGRRQRIDDLLLQEEHAQLLWSLLRGVDEDGQGASVYICGQVSFAKTVMTAIKTILFRFAAGMEEERARSAHETLSRLVAENRCLLEVFTTYPGATTEQHRFIPASEVVLHNNDANGYWMIISGRVYDLTEFAHLHPGGVKIVHSYAGMDGTEAYQEVLHHVRPEVDAMLGLYEIGVVKRLDFGAPWGIMVGRQGLDFISLADAYRMWIRLLYLVVEMENALRNDFTIQDRATTADEDATTRSPYKLRFVIEVHQRFLVNYVHGLCGEPLYELWAMFCGFWAPAQDTRWMQRTVEAILEGEEARAVHEFSMTLASDLRNAPDATHGSVEPSQAVCQFLESQDKQFLHEIKMALRAGLLLFETWEEAVVKRAPDEVMPILKRIPIVLETYFARVSAGLSQSRSEGLI